MNYILLTSLSLFMMSVSAKQEQETFLQAGQLYQEGNIKEAYELYESLPIKSAGTLYNMGNCAYRLGHPGRALGYWLQALKLAPRFMYPWLLQNIAYVQSELGLSQLAWWQTGVLYVHTYMRLLFVQLFILFIAALLLGLWFTKRLHTRLGIGLGICLIVPLSLTIMTYVAWYTPSIVVIDTGCSLHTGPDEQFPAIKEITVGARARVVGDQDSWYKISYLKERGWIQKSCVMTVT